MTQQDKEHSLLIRLLSQICECYPTFGWYGDDCLHLEDVRHMPDIWFDEDDVKLIKELEETECEDFSHITTIENIQNDNEDEQD